MSLNFVLWLSAHTIVLLKRTKINKIKNLINVIFDKNDAIENNIKKNPVANSQNLEIKEVIEFLNSNSKRGITTFEND